MSGKNIQEEGRKDKATRLKELGHSTYAHRYERSATISRIVSDHRETTAEQLEDTPVQVRVAGRLRAFRPHGKTAFLDLNDGANRLQVYAHVKSLPESDSPLLKLIDIGDFLGVEGTLFRTRTGELTVKATKLDFLSKSLRPLPEKWHGLEDQETRYRQRYLDLIGNEETRDRFILRSRTIAALREFLNEHGYLEVETPMMQSMHGGATAKPFRTHHKALDLDLYLRIAPELFLKRLLVGGFEKVYEINRNFRNEGLSTQHNPEFTMLEFYEAYSHYRDLLGFTEEMIAYTAEKVIGTLEIERQGETISFKPPFHQITYHDALVEIGEIDAKDLTTEDGIRRVAVADGIESPEKLSAAKLTGELFERRVEKKLIQPTYVLDHPVALSPLAKARPDQPEVVERFELFVGGIEIANGYSELNDPAEQLERFEQQAASRAQGDEEAHRVDRDYVKALEYGMPPAAGEGIGIDRLVMLLTGASSIRDVILFPLLRPKTSEES